MIDKQFVDLFERLESTLSGGFKRLATVAEAQNKQRRPSHSTTLEKQRDVRRRNCLLFELVMTNTSEATEYYILLVDKDRPASDGDTPAVAGPKVPPGGYQGSMQYAGGRPFERGLQVVASTTPHVVTLPSENVCWFDVLIEA
jgi:hypothetical protein